MSPVKIIAPKKNYNSNHHFLAYVFIFMFVVILGMFFYFSSVDKKISMRTIYKLETNFYENEPFGGNFLISLNEGELIPYDAKLVLSYGGEEKSYFLHELIKTSPVEGNYFLKDVLDSGNGLGYGVEGEKKTMPEVNFVLKIKSLSEGGSEEGEVTEEIEEAIEEESTEGTEETTNSIDEITEEIDEATEEETEETITPIDEAKEEEITVDEPVGSSSSMITGNSISGRVSAGFEKEISGSLTADSPFIYYLEEGESYELVSSSQEVSLKKEGNKLTVTTGFSLSEKGFGKDYLGKNTYDLSVNLAELNLNPGEGLFKASLVYEDLEIISISTTLDYKKPISEIPVEEEIIEDVFEFNLGSPQDYALTSSEKMDLMRAVGTHNSKITKSELVGNRLVVRFEVGKYWRENSYSYPDDNLDFLIELDRAKFMKSLARELGKKSDSKTKVEQYLG
jgi:hypothetical protein